MSDEIKLTEDHMRITFVKIASDNNVLLRMLLYNQQRIMDKLGIEQDIPEALMRDLLSQEESKEKDPLKKVNSDMFYCSVQAVESISNLVRERSIQWAKHNAKIIKKRGEF